MSEYARSLKRAHLARLHKMWPSRSPVIASTGPRRIPIVADERVETIPVNVRSFSTINLDEIMGEVAEAHRVTAFDLRGAGRNRRLSHARQEFCYRAAWQTRASLAAIGRYIERDHTTVIHNVGRFALDNNLPFPRGLTPERVVLKTARDREYWERCKKAKSLSAGPSTMTRT